MSEERWYILVVCSRDREKGRLSSTMVRPAVLPRMVAYIGHCMVQPIPKCVNKVCAGNFKYLGAYGAKKLHRNRINSVRLYQKQASLVHKSCF